MKKIDIFFYFIENNNNNDSFMSNIVNTPFQILNLVRSFLYVNLRGTLCAAKNVALFMKQLEDVQEYANKYSVKQYTQILKNYRTKIAHLY